MALSSIQWLRPPKADLSGPRDGYTWNPWRGCSKISRGCKNCYAEALAARNPATLGQWGPDAPRSFGSMDNLRLPLKWQKEAHAALERRLVFLGSLMDIGEERPDLSDMQDYALGTVLPACPTLDFCLTSKRPYGLLRNCERAWGGFWPANAWPIVTAEGAAELTARTPAILELAKRGAKVVGLSLEPLLDNPFAPLSDLLETLGGLVKPPEVWLIWGGESGKNARPFHCDWIRQGLGLARTSQSPDVFSFVKQLGEAGYDIRNHTAGPKIPNQGSRPWKRWTGEGGDPAEWPSDLRVRQWPGLYPAEVFNG